MIVNEAVILLFFLTKNLRYFIKMLNYFFYYLKKSFRSNTTTAYAENSVPNFGLGIDTCN